MEPPRSRLCIVSDWYSVIDTASRVVRCRGAAAVIAVLLIGVSAIHGKANAEAGGVEPETPITIGYRNADTVAYAKAMAAHVSSIRGDDGKANIVLVFYGNDESVRDEILRGASQAKDEFGEPIQVLGLLVAPGDTNEFEVYGDGYPSSKLLGPKNAEYLAKAAVEQIQYSIIEPDFFALDEASEPAAHANCDADSPSDTSLTTSSDE